MGIRFYCPQGHKLNVKSFLAGKKGICPHCNAKVDIPLQSTRPSAKDEQAAGRGARTVPVAGPGAQAPNAGAATTTAAPLARPVAMPAINAPMAVLLKPTEPISPFPIPIPGKPAVPVSGQISVPTSGPGPSAAAMPLKPAPLGAPSVPSQMPTFGAASPRMGELPPAPVPAPAALDPIAEAPHAVWYVRPASGGQFGPASGDVLRQWIQQGRVAPDSLVWRDGWPGWKQATEILPQAPQSPAATAAAPFEKIENPLESALSSPLPAGRIGIMRQNARERSNVTAMIIVVTLALVVLGLGAVLLWMLMHR